MKTPLLLTTALIAFGATLFAAPLDPKGIPADAQGIAHFDFDASAKSQLGQTLKKFAEQSIADDSSKQKEYDEFKKLTGIDPMTDLNGATIGFFKSADKEEPSVVAVIRGKFSPETIMAAAKEKKLAVSTQDGLTVIEFAEPDAAEGKKSGAKQFSLAIADKNTLLVAQQKTRLPALASALAGKTKSFELPAALGVFGTQEGTPILLSYIGRELTPETGKDGSSPIQISKAEKYLVSLAENGANLRARIYSEYATEEAARKMHGTVQMILGFAQMGASQAASSGKPNAAENAERIQKLISGFNAGQKDKSLNITLEYPSADLIKIAEEQNKAAKAK